MTEMLDFGWSERPYWDRKNWSSLESYKEALKISSTLYVGNLSFYTQESQIYALFDQVCRGISHPHPLLSGGARLLTFTCTVRCNLGNGELG